GFNDNKYYAIQCKFRKLNPLKKKTGIPWKQLSTFYALVYKTGPYEKHIVMTNTNFVRHVGKKTKKDLSICYGTFKNIGQFDWIKMISNKENKIQDLKKESINLKLVQLREKRLKYYENKFKNNVKII
ncbi:unnamed protein product, partial [marine sediment metagenome]